MFDRIYLPILLLFITFAYTLNSCFYTYFGVVFSLKDFLWALQNAAQVGMHAGAIKWWIIITNIILFVIFALGIVLFNTLWRFKVGKKEFSLSRKRKVAFALILFGGSAVSFEFCLQMWNIAQRNKGINDIDYVNYSPNYHFNQLGMIGYYTQETRQLTFDKGESIDSFKEYMNASQTFNDDYTNFFEKNDASNPNIIVIMLETGDECILDPVATPNLYNFLNNGLNCTNNYSYNHTDVSEAIGINGNYPQYHLTDMGTVKSPFNLPNLLKEKKYKTYFTHDIDESNDIYNRIKSMQTYGFDKCLFHDDVIPEVAPWVWKDANYTRDSIYIDGLINKHIKQFSHENPFYMHYTTVHMHMSQVLTKGNKEMFSDLESEFGGTLDNSQWQNPFQDGSEDAKRYRRLILKAMDFDKGLGNLMNVLYGENAPDYLKNTLLVVYGDHSWYEECASSGIFGEKIRNIYDINNIKLYPTILGFYHPTLNKIIGFKYNHKIELPTWPTIIVPTILDLLGNDHCNPKMYLNKSVFDKTYNKNEIFYSFWTTRAMNEQFASFDHYHINKVYSNDLNKKEILSRLEDLRIRLRMIDTIYKKNIFNKYDYNDFMPKGDI